VSTIWPSPGGAVFQHRTDKYIFHPNSDVQATQHGRAARPNHKSAERSVTPNAVAIA
jgi:hypothetical protein